MDIIKVFKLFPTQRSCVLHLENIIWTNGPICPYCLTANNISPQKKENRYHCNFCQSGFSITVNTIFHNTKLPLQKWFLAIFIVLNADKQISVRQLQCNLKITYKTAWYVMLRVKRAMIEQRDMLVKLVEVNETYIIDNSLNLEDS